MNEDDWTVIGAKFITVEHDIEEILIRLKNLEENQEQITEILWDELKRKVW
tara:strand:+ start:505 stop:657 length:153 start_codon:yes stop_codon:yes gene_type:complete